MNSHLLNSVVTSCPLHRAGLIKLGAAIGAGLAAIGAGVVVLVELGAWYGSMARQPEIYSVTFV